jgi:DNA-binding NtrC family response regulator
MGSLSESLFESEMFGHIKGSFTDAREDRVGRFETASGGTLFMDEIANLSLASQSKLLGVLQNLQITRIGSSRPIAVDFRLISATNKDPQLLLRQGLFREDLLFRINTIQIELPPLRERREDIPGLSEFYLKQFSLKYEKPQMKFSDSAYDSLINYYWSGNIRELKHTIEKAVILTENALIKPSDLDLRPRFSDPSVEHDEKLADIEKSAIVKVLEKCRGNITQAAKILDISRTTLYTKMKEYKI